MKNNDKINILSNKNKEYFFLKTEVLNLSAINSLNFFK